MTNNLANTGNSSTTGEASINFDNTGPNLSLDESIATIEESMEAIEDANLPLNSNHPTNQL